MSYEDYVSNKKNYNSAISNIDSIKKELRNHKEEHKKIHEKIKEVEKKMKEIQDINDKRFGELYAYLIKMEKTYYNGLSIPNQSSSNVANTQELFETSSTNGLNGDNLKNYFF